MDPQDGTSTVSPNTPRPFDDEPYARTEEHTEASEYESAPPKIPTTAAIAAEVVLPCGLLVDGKRVRDAVVTPLTVRDRKTVFDASTRRNAGKVATKLLASKVRSVGGEKVTEEMLRDMLTADRDFLLLKIGQLTHGSELMAEGQCDNLTCRTKFDLTINLDDIPVREMPGVAEEEMVHEGRWYWETSLPDTTPPISSVKFWYPTGGMLEQVAGQANDLSALPEIEARYMALMMFGWDGGPGLTREQVEDLPVRMFNKLEDEMLAHAFGPDLRDTVNCPECGVETGIDVDITSFLFAGARRRGRTAKTR